MLQLLHVAAAFAPLRTPAALALIGFEQQHFPGLPQIACFDTQCHADWLELAQVLPIARELQSEGIQRDGFHSLSLGSIVRQLVHDLSPRLVVAHLGNGACVTALKVGLSIDTSNGMVARTRAKYPCVLTNRRKAQRRTTRQSSRADFFAWNVELAASRSSCELRPPAWQTAWRPGANTH